MQNLTPVAEKQFERQKLTLIPACISKQMPSKMWYEITYPFLNFNGAPVEVY